MTPEQIEELEAKVKKLQEEHDKALEAIEAKDARIAELEKAAKPEEKDEIDKSKLDPETLERIEKMEAQAKADREKAAETEAKLRKMEDERQDEILRADLRKSLPNTPQVDELVPVFKSLSEDEAKILKTKLSAGDAAIGMGFKDIGRTVRDETDTAAGQIRKLADDIRKADPGLSPEQARVKARRENRELAIRERQERQH